MKRCPRCGHWHDAIDTTMCVKCWEEIGQMHLWPDEDEEVIVLNPYDDEYLPVSDTVFDREEEARGYQ